MLKIAKKQKVEPAILINFKLTLAEKKVLLEKAKKYARGNLSLWLRYAAINHQPPKKDLV